MERRNQPKTKRHSHYSASEHGERLRIPWVLLREKTRWVRFHLLWLVLASFLSPSLFWIEPFFISHVGSCQWLIERTLVCTPWQWKTSLGRMGGLGRQTICVPMRRSREQTQPRKEVQEWPSNEGCIVITQKVSKRVERATACSEEEEISAKS